MAHSKITIKDIASRTGLSKGTVDRVLHNRGEVSKKTYEKVMAVIEELGYQPDVTASLLARRGVSQIVLLLPRQEPGSFWELAASGIQRAQANLQTLRVQTVLLDYDQNSAESFKEACTRMLDSQPDGVVIAPMFRSVTLQLTELLKDKGIPYVFIDSKLELEGYLAYFGMPMYKSGYLCADVLTSGQPISEVLIVRVHRDKERQSDPTVNRRAGFMDYILQQNPDCAIHSRFIDPTDPAQTSATLDAFFEEHPSVRHIVMFNSRVHLLVPWLQAHPSPERRVVGFDNLAANINAVRYGLVHVLIGQHPDVQVTRAIETLADYIVLGRVPAKRDHFMHMDILTRYNIDDY